MCTGPEQCGTREELGWWGEQFSCIYLTRTLGWKILFRNWHCRWGELDVVAHNDRFIVVVEVRTRSGTGFGTALESVDDRKRRRLAQLTEQFLWTHSNILAGSLKEPRVRIDVIAIWAQAYRVRQFTHVRNAVYI